MSNGNVQIVKDSYEAFLKGNMDTLFAAMHAEIDWESVGRQSDFPSLGPRSGISAVQDFFRTVADAVDFHAFTPREFHGVGDMVFVMGEMDATVRRTGKRAASEWIHVFWLKDGKIARFREFADTARFAEAWRD